MRVLVVDQDSASNEAIVRSLRDLYTVDAVTNKGDCLDLLRSNTFEVIVSGERLADGSGLELLGQVARKWPSVLRIFAADRDRLKLLEGRLGPFELFQTLSYPIDPERLIATLSLADAAQDANADTANIQHVVLSSESPADVSEDTREPAESVQSRDFPAPRPVSRISPVEHAEAPSRSLRGAGRGGPAQRARPAPPGQRLRANAAAGLPTGSSRARGVAPLPSLPSRGGRPPRYDPSRGASNKAPPVRFPPLPKVPSLEPSQASWANRSSSPQTNTLAAAAAARSNFDSPVVESNAGRLAIMLGGGAAVVLAVAVLGYKLFNSRSEPPPPAPPPVVHAPLYPQEVTGSVAQTESPTPGHSSSSTGPATKKRNGQSRRNGVKAAPANESSGSQSSPTLALETPPGLSRATGASVEAARADAAPPAPGVAAPAGSAPEGAPALTASAPASVSASAPATTVASAPAVPVGAPASAPATTGPSAPPPLAHVQASTSPTKVRVSAGEPPPVVREAKLIRRVNPDYPSAAKRDGMEGSVDLEVTVSARGVVENVAVVHATPPDVFEKAALAAVRKWRYDPRFVDGLPSEAHLNVHLEFKPQ